MNTGVHVSGYQVARHAATDFGDSPVGQFGQRTVSIAGSRPPHPSLREMFSGIVRKLASFNFMAPAAEKLARRADNEVRQAVRQTSEKLGYMLGIAANRTGYPMQVVCEALAKEFKSLDEVAGGALDGPVGSDQRAGERDGLVRERLTLHLRNMSAEQMRDLSSGLDALRREGNEALAPLLTLVGEARQTVAQEFGHRARVAVDQVVKQPAPTTPQEMATLVALVVRASDVLRQGYVFETGAITEKIKVTANSQRLASHLDSCFERLPASLQSRPLSALDPKAFHQFTIATTACNTKAASIAVRQDAVARQQALARPVTPGLRDSIQAGASRLAAQAHQAKTDALKAPSTFTDHVTDDFARDFRRAKYFIEVDGQLQPLIDPSVHIDPSDKAALTALVEDGVKKLHDYLGGDKQLLTTVSSVAHQGALADFTFDNGTPHRDLPLRLDGKPAAGGRSTDYVEFIIRKQEDGSVTLKSTMSRQAIQEVTCWERVPGSQAIEQVKYSVDPLRTSLLMTAETRIFKDQVTLLQTPTAHATLAGAVRIPMA